MATHSSILAWKIPWMEEPDRLQSMVSQRVGHDWVTSLHFNSETYMRTDAFELWCWRKLRVPWTAKRSNQSILKEISPGCLLEGLILKLKLQYFGHLMQRADPFEKTLMLRKIEGGRRRGWQDEMVGWPHWLDRHEFELALGVGDGQGALGCCSLWGHRVGHNWETELNWTDTLNEKTV